jgi:hypothetical protein
MLQLMAATSKGDQKRDPMLRLQAQRAKKVLPLASRKHLVLVTLLFTVSLTDVVLPLCIDAIAPTWVAILVSVVFTLFFTEILPTAVFTDQRSSVKLAAATAPFVWLLIALFGAVTWPLSKVVDIIVEKAERRLSDEEHHGFQVAQPAEERDEDEQVPACTRRRQSEAYQMLKLSRLQSLLKMLMGACPERREQCDTTMVYRNQLRMMLRVSQLSSMNVSDVAIPVDRLLLPPEAWKADRLVSISFLQLLAVQRESRWFLCKESDMFVAYDTRHLLGFVDAIGSERAVGSVSLIDAAALSPACRVVPRTVGLSVTLAEVLESSSVRDLLLATGDDGHVEGVLDLACVYRLTAEDSVRDRRKEMPARDESQYVSDDNDDIEAILEGPRAANKVPWSMMYSTSHVLGNY